MKKQYVRPLMILAIAGLWLTTPDSLYAQVKNFKKVDAEKQPLDCNVPPIIHCPETFEACPGASTDPKTTGFPEAFPGNAACGTPLLSFSDRVVQSGTCPGAQLVQRVWTAQDPDNPNLRAFCIQYINTLDTTPPRFLNCPRDTAILSNSECTATFRWTMPWITDECGSFCSTSSHPNGGSFTIGLHTIIITATDACGNSSTCQFTLEVIENCCVQPPVITCPAEYITCPGKSIAPEVSGKPEVQKATPACHEPKLSYSDKILNTSSCNMLIERTWTAVDPDNPALFASCIQLIHMEDKTPPVITFCPRDITV
ncbi:MAG TPA: HYR domain-containing protein, partial [Saprospiraceae bacterium]|nr:HYR domain-containing protein [Saprospiraceae bacterium]